MRPLPLLALLCCLKLSPSCLPACLPQLLGQGGLEGAAAAPSPLASKQLEADRKKAQQEAERAAAAAQQLAVQREERAAAAAEVLAARVQEAAGEGPVSTRAPRQRSLGCGLRPLCRLLSSVCCCCFACYSPLLHAPACHPLP